MFADRDRRESCSPRTSSAAPPVTPPPFLLALLAGGNCSSHGRIRGLVAVPLWSGAWEDRAHAGVERDEDE